MSGYEPPRLRLPVGARDHILGDANASLTLLEYGDFECPHCRAAEPVVQAIRKQFGSQLQFVFRNFPLTQVHPHAQQAAEAAEAAGQQGRFWEMHDTLFAHQNALAMPDLLRYAKKLDLDTDTFNEAINGHSFADKVHEDFTSGVRSGVNGTPTFFINGFRYDGPAVFELLAETLEAVARRLQRD